MGRQLRGAFVISRDIFSSKVWKKPVGYIKVWLYILGNVNHASTALFSRGENMFNFADSYAKIGVSKRLAYRFLEWARKESMIETRKTTRGIVIKVLNYGKYQSLENYRGRQNERQNGTQIVKRGYTINNNVNNDKKKFYLYENPKNDFERDAERTARQMAERPV